MARLLYGLSGFVERRHSDEMQGENVHVNASIYSSYVCLEHSFVMTGVSCHCFQRSVFS